MSASVCTKENVWLDTYKDSSNVKQNSLAALYAFHEYLSNSLIKLQEFVRDDIQYDGVISMLHDISDSSATALCLTREQYHHALEDLDGSTLLTDGSGAEILVSNSEIADYIENSAAEIACQKEYVGSCLTGLQMKASEYITRVKALFPGVTGDRISKYASLIDDSSLIGSLQNLFQLNSYVNVNKDEEDVITVVSTEGYTGVNVWIVALQQIGDQIAYFFRDVVWKGIMKIGDFFRSILDGLKRFGIWLVGKLCSQLLTNYTQASGAVGLMDFPIFQFCLGKIENFNSSNGEFILNIDPDISGYNFNLIQFGNTLDTLIYNNNHINLKDETYNNMNKFRSRSYQVLTNQNCLTDNLNQPFVGCHTLLAANLYNLVYILIHDDLVTDNHEGNFSLKPIDIILPGADLLRFAKQTYGDSYWDPDYDSKVLSSCIRFGFDNDKRLWMQYYVIDTYDNFHAQTDGANRNRISATMGLLLNLIGFEYNVIMNDTLTSLMYSGDYVSNFNYLCDYAHSDEWVAGMPPSEDEGTYDLVGDLIAVNLNKYIYNHATDQKMYRDEGNNRGGVGTYYITCIYALLAYALMNSKTHEKDLMNTSYAARIKSTLLNTDRTFTIPNGWVLNTLVKADSLTTDAESSVSAFKVSKFTFDSFDSNYYTVGANLFTPYSKNQLTPIAIHYQTINEQATEIRNAIWTVIIAAAVIYFSYKIIKFTKNRKMKAYLAEAAMDSAAWNYADDPTSENFSLFKKARKKYVRTAILNNIFGITSGAAITASSENASMILENIRGVQNSDNGPSIASVSKLIKS